MRHPLGLAALVAAVWATILAPQGAEAGVSAVGAGVSFQAPIGNVYQTLGRSTGVQAELSWTEPALGPDYEIHLDGSYHGYSILGLTGGKIHTFGIYGGLETARKSDRVSPFFGLEIGGLYDALGLDGGSTTSNSGFAFALKLNPGIDIPIFDRLSAAIELPVSFAFFKTALTTWSGVIGARWKL